VSAFPVEFKNIISGLRALLQRPGKTAEGVTAATQSLSTLEAESTRLRDQVANLEQLVRTLHTDSWGAAQQRHSDALEGAQARHDDAVITAGVRHQDLITQLQNDAGTHKLHLNDLADLARSNHQDAWDSSRVLQTEILQRFGRLERAVRAGTSQSPAAIGNSTSVREVQAALRLRHGEAAPADQSVVEIGDLSLEFPADDSVMLPYIREHLEWEPHVAKALASHVKPGDLALDLGAHVGTFSCLLARAVGPTGTVVAAEPDPDNAALLRRNLIRNSIANVLLVEAAVGPDTGVTSLFRSPTGNTGDARIVPWDESGEELQVAMVRLQDLLPQGVRVALIKVDVQGFDHTLLMRSEEILRESRPVVVMEFTPASFSATGDKPTEFLDWFTSLGYSVEVLNPANEIQTGKKAVLAAAAASPIGYVDLLFLPSLPL
jgi:FkbM family methyltransferase